MSDEYLERALTRIDQLERELAQAKAELAAVREDAERYKFIKSIEGQALTIHVLRHVGADGLDAAIDSAREQQPGGRGE